MVSIPPVVTALESLEVLDVDQLGRQPEPNSEALLSEARDRLLRHKEPFVPSLTFICTEVLRKHDFYPDRDDVEHLRHYWDGARYICASCKNVISSLDPRYLSASLRERFTRFNPCVTQLAATGILPRGTTRTTYVISSPTWTFCAPCLELHMQENWRETPKMCHCLACSAARKLWLDQKAIRWAKLHIAV